MPKSPEKMQAVKNCIFKAAMELFELKGYENTSVEEITKKAGVSKGTFFTHFATKESVFSAIGKIFTEYMQDIIEAGLREDRSTQQILKESIHMVANWCKENKPMIRQVFTSGMYQPSLGSRSTSNRMVMVKLLGRVIKAGQIQGEFNKDMAVEEAATILTGMYFTIIFDWINDGYVWSLEDKLISCLKLLYWGFRP